MRLFSGIQVIPVVYLTQCRGVMARTRSAVLCRNARASISSVLCVPSYRASPPLEGPLCISSTTWEENSVAMVLLFQSTRPDSD